MATRDHDAVVSTGSAGGNSADPLNYEPELVHIPAGEFWIGRYPVRVAEFARFLENYGPTAAGEDYWRRTGSFWPALYGASSELGDSGRHPATFVSLRDALLYCRWLSEITGRAYGLPTQEQWESAAGAQDGRAYPWGNDEPDRDHCNVENWFGGTTPAGRFSPAGDGPMFDNAYGCADMVGNVSELTTDVYTSAEATYPDWELASHRNASTTYSVLCGASWRTGRQTRTDLLREDHVRDDVGFRVVAYLQA